MVDDDRDSAGLAETILKGAGAQVRTCESAPDALSLVTAWRPDVLVSDIEMPGEDGYSLIRKVRELAADAGPFPAPDRTLLSDDDRLYLTWLFARDERQAGAATATLRRVEWSIDQAVPKFLADGNLSEAARRAGVDRKSFYKLLARLGLKERGGT